MAPTKLEMEIDAQQNAVITFKARYEAFKNEKPDKQTIERAKSYNDERDLMWKKIQMRHDFLAKNSPSQQYMKDYIDIQAENEEWVQQLSTWGVKSPQTTTFPLNDDNDEQKTLPSIIPQASPNYSNSTGFPNPTAPMFLDQTSPILLNILQMLADSTAQSRTLKLPELKIPEFSGDIREYRIFKESFEHAIKDSKCSKESLFRLLKSHLKGDAYSKIEFFALSPHSYDLAWQTLDDNYDNRRKLIELEIKDLLSHPNVKYNDLTTERSFNTLFQRITANVKQMNITANDILMVLFTNKFEKELKTRFDDYIGDTKQTPPTEKLTSFMTREINNCPIHNTETLTSTQTNNSKANHNSKPSRTNVMVTTNNSQSTCLICNQHHKTKECDELLSSTNKMQLIKSKRVCRICLNHIYISNCRQYGRIKCNICHSKTHNTLLHPLEEQSSTTRVTTLITQNESNNVTILPTAIANVMEHTGKTVKIRCLIDQCSERSYISEMVVQSLRLKREKANLNVIAINGLTYRVKQKVNLVIKLDNNKEIKTDAFVIPKITDGLPIRNGELPKELRHLKLADPESAKMSMVGILLGGEITSEIFVGNVPNIIHESGLLLQSTNLGWILSGRNKRVSKSVSAFVTLNENIETLQRDKELTERIIQFYELPEVESLGDEDKYTEELYTEKHYRLTDGRYVVPTPWSRTQTTLGHSYSKAVKLFLSQEKKWKMNTKHYEMSNKFMQEYEVRGHMSRVSRLEEKNMGNKVYYIPYHSIIRENAVTTKLRNVFNASFKSSNGNSLNDIMLQGPKLQTNIRDILTTARSFKYIYSADISMMFRQIFVIPDDRRMQRIIWRPTSNEPLREYSLNTVTYGTDAAPYLAIRTIHQCAKDNAPSEKIEAIIQKAFYVDDLLFGADTIEEAQQQIHDIQITMQAGKFPLTKWASNHQHVLKNIPESDRLSSYMSQPTTTVKLLGVKYDFQDDEFKLDLKIPEVKKFTKRTISSAAASFYDPLGFILPFIMMLRIFLKGVWSMKVDWDEILNDDTKQAFQRIIDNVTDLNSISIPRHVCCDSQNILEIIGFSDASNHAQAAVVYSRERQNGTYRIKLLLAKGNVSKLKTAAVLDSKQNTIPKLELEAISTLTDLFKIIKSSLSHRTLRFIGYTDSQVALAWVRSTKKLTNKFVERRVTRIRSVLEPSQLHYVKSEENPADPASRGLSADNLSKCSLWFDGPSFLQNEVLPTTPYESPKVQTYLTNTKEIEDMFIKYSSWSMIIRIVAYCLRWRTKESRPFLCGAELKTAKQRIIKYYQNLHLGGVISSLEKGCQVPKRHWLYNLSPFVDQQGILRVGGRLANADYIPDNQKYPIVIPSGNCKWLLVLYTHKANLHSSNSLTLQILVSEYWIPGIKGEIKSCIRRCVRCIRWNAKVIQPQMSQLPKERITPSNTFEKIGIDLCGPFTIRASPLKFERTMKIWVVNFICMATKAVHLEVVSSLSAEHFLASFTRFCSRRGTSCEIWTDNGTNFVGANRLLRETWLSIIKKCEEKTALQDIKWKFIPKHSPTFGGLWEASVKSLKYFVKRMDEVKNLTLEEFETLMCRIEALLNSRPLFKNPLTPNDPLALTPFHFINQRGLKLTAIDGSINVPLTKKWLMIHKIQNEFWNRFQTEYLRELQSRNKWQRNLPNLKVNDLVLIKEPSINPGDWKMGLIKNTFPDPKGIVRKANIITADKKVSLHAINQLVPLLTEEDAPARPPKTRLQRNLMSPVHLCLMILFVFVPLSSCSVSSSKNHIIKKRSVKIIDIIRNPIKPLYNEPRHTNYTPLKTMQAIKELEREISNNTPYVPSTLHIGYLVGALLFLIGILIIAFRLYTRNRTVRQDRWAAGWNLNHPNIINLKEIS